LQPRVVIPTLRAEEEMPEIIAGDVVSSFVLLKFKPHFYILLRNLLGGVTFVKHNAAFGFQMPGSGRDEAMGSIIKALIRPATDCAGAGKASRSMIANRY